MYKLIGSNTVKDYLNKINYELTPLQKATLIWNSESFTWEKKLNLLKELAKNSDDKKLSEEIRIKIAKEKEKFKFLKKAHNKKFIYIAALDEGSEFSLFYNYKQAYDYITAYAEKVKSCFNINMIQPNRYLEYKKKNGDYFSIEHNPSFSDKPVSEWDFVENYQFNNMPVIRTRFNDKGQLEWIRKEPEDLIDIFSDDYENKFENSYIEIPLPFTEGMIVKYIKGYAMYGIIPDKSHEGFFVKNPKNDFNDFVINVLLLNSEGYWQTAQFNPLELEDVSNKSLTNVPIEFENVLKTYRKYLLDKNAGNKKEALDSLQIYRNIKYVQDFNDIGGDELFEVKNLRLEETKMPVYVREVNECF